MDSCDVAIVGSGFAGSLLARVLAVIGYEVVLLERGRHPRFAIGESSTPLANLSLERIATRYGFSDCYHLATHGRWLAHHSELRRGLKRGFTFYRHHPRTEFADRGYDSERLLVAASPDDALSDTHWLRADVDHHFVRQATAVGVDYRDQVNLTTFSEVDDGVRLTGSRAGAPFVLHAGFVIDASGPGGFLVRQLSIPSALEGTATRSALLSSHFTGARLLSDVLRMLPPGPYPDDWAAVHHIIDEGWMYSLRFDDGLTSAGFLLSPPGAASLGAGTLEPARLWDALLDRYPTIGAAFGSATPVMPIGYRPLIQHRLARAAGARWVLMPHAYAFVDPLFSTGIAWTLRAVERLGGMFEDAKRRQGLPRREQLQRYEDLLALEADQIDRMVAGAYEAMAQFETFAAQAMLYFATVSFAEVSQRVRPGDGVEWSGFLGADDPVLASLPAASLARLRSMDMRSRTQRDAFVDWIRASIAPRNVAGLADPARRNLYPVDLDALIEAHSRLGLSRDQVAAALPALRGQSPEPVFAVRVDRSISRSAQQSPAPAAAAPR